MSVRTIGILFETIDDARLCGRPIQYLDHWRDENELQAIEQAIQAAGFKTIRLGTPQMLVHDCVKIKRDVDFIFTLSVGFVTRFRQGYGAMACELAGIPYTGPDPFVKITAQNKQMMKAFYDTIGVRTPRWVYLHDHAALDRAITLSTYPLIVKPTCEGTSVGIDERAIVTGPGELREYCAYLFTELGMPLIVEEFIRGREYKIGFVGEGPRTFRGVIEDVHHDGTPLQDRIIHYGAKRDRLYGKVKRDIGVAGLAEMVAWCDRIYSYFGPADYAVFDIRQDEMGRCYLIEYNADATLHPHKTLATCCALHGIGFDKMVQSILYTAIARWGIV
jgi:D-alanine-D-alanine ligase